MTRATASTQEAPTRIASGGGRGRALFAALRALYLGLDRIVHEIMKFGVVGAVAFVVDVGTFNLLVHTEGMGPLHDKPLTAKAVAVILATTVAYFGNRHWTFRHRDRHGLGREYALFFLLNGVGLAIALSCLGFSRYALHLQSVLADNISANVIGLGLGTLFRFWSYRRWVFPEMSGDAADPGVRSATVSPLPEPGAAFDDVDEVDEVVESDDDAYDEELRVG